MQTDVLDQIEDASLRAYVAWVPVLPEDNQAAAVASASLVPDARAAHFWDATGALPPAFAPVLSIEPPAWDVYLLYAPGVRWGASPPRPAYWEHQLGPEMQAPRLDGARFRQQVAGFLRAM